MTSSEFPILPITQEAFEASSNETLGSKYKFWFDSEELGRCLYKQNRPNLGEDWAEKVASELCELLGLPHATYELASTWTGSRGVISPNFLPPGGTLIHGNELLSSLIPNYPAFGTYGISQHTLDLVITAISRESVTIPKTWTPPDGILTAVDVFVGYLLLDAWIGNGDRHHENWGIIRIKAASTSEEPEHLAPTYDHASSLGRDLDDSQRQNRSVAAYANKCFSAFYDSVEERKPLKTFEVFSRIARRYPAAARVWLLKLESIQQSCVVEIFNRINSERISAEARRFALSILAINQQRLLTLKEPS